MNEPKYQATCPEHHFLGMTQTQRARHGSICPACRKILGLSESTTTPPPPANPPEPQGRVEFIGPLWRATIRKNFSGYFGTEKECHQFIIENLP